MYFSSKLDGYIIVYRKHGVKYIGENTTLYHHAIFKLRNLQLYDKKKLPQETWLLITFKNSVATSLTFDVKRLVNRIVLQVRI